MKILRTTQQQHAQPSAIGRANAGEGKEVRRMYRVPVGLPVEQPRAWGVLVSLLVHVLILVLFITPILGSSRLDNVPLGAGGLGPIGGGGGGTRGSGGAEVPHEKLRFVSVAPPAPAAVPQPTPQPVEKKVPEVKPLPTPTPTVPQPITPPASVQPSTPNPQEQVAIAPGTGGGTGNDGTGGAGPGTGGGVGTGVGAGRGSAEGEGAGGGTGTVYPATPEFLVIPSLPVPKRAHGKTIELHFTIDERGKILKVEFESSGDTGYDRQLRERLLEYRFRPAHKMDGTPVPSVYVTQLTL